MDILLFVVIIVLFFCFFNNVRPYAGHTVTRRYDKMLLYPVASVRKLGGGNEIVRYVSIHGDPCIMEKTILRKLVCIPREYDFFYAKCSGSL